MIGLSLAQRIGNKKQSVLATKKNIKNKVFKSFNAFTNKENCKKLKIQGISYLNLFFRRTSNEKEKEVKEKSQPKADCHRLDSSHLCDSNGSG